MNINLHRNTHNWRDIVAIFSDSNLIVGLKADGTIVMNGKNGRNFYNACNDWHNIGPVDKDRYIVQQYDSLVDAANKASTENEFKDLAKKFRGMRGYSNTEEWAIYCEGEKHRIEQAKSLKKQGLCGHCGGELSGFFTKKCKSCGETA